MPSTVRNLLVVLLSAFLCCSDNAYAGFIIKSPTGAAISNVILNKGETDSVHHKHFKSRDETFRESGRAERRARRNEQGHEGEKDGWAGIVALVCACVFYGPLAILFGAIGMQKGRKNRKLAKGAFIAGLIETGLMVLFYTFIFVLIFSSM